MIKKLILAITCFLQLTIASAQSADQRAVTTKIADVLAVMPANDKAQLNKSMQLLATLNEQGLRELIGMLSPLGSGDNTKVEYAIAGYSFYVTEPGNEEKRKVAVKAFCSSLAGLSDQNNKDFIIRQLQVTGKDDAVPCLQKFPTHYYLPGSPHHYHYACSV